MKTFLHACVLIFLLLTTCPAQSALAQLVTPNQRELEKKIKTLMPELQNLEKQNKILITELQNLEKQNKILIPELKKKGTEPTGGTTPKPNISSVPDWFVGVFCLAFLVQIIILAYFINIHRIVGQALKFTEDAKNGVDEVKPLIKSLTEVLTKIDKLQQEISDIRNSQEPILRLAMNRLSAPSPFPFLPLLPQVSKVEPDRGMPAGYTKVIISGENFLKGAQVWFGETPGTVDLTTSETTKLEVRAPGGFKGDVDVRVVNLSGMMSPQGQARYKYAEFSLDKVDPPTNRGDLLVLSGVGFCKETRVFFDTDNNGIQPNDDISDTELKIPLPKGTKGQTRTVLLENPGKDRSNQQTFDQPFDNA